MKRKQQMDQKFHLATIPVHGRLGNWKFGQVVGVHVDAHVYLAVHVDLAGDFAADGELDGRACGYTVDQQFHAPVAGGELDFRRWEQEPDARAIDGKTGRPRVVLHQRAFQPPDGVEGGGGGDVVSYGSYVDFRRTHVELVGRVEGAVVTADLRRYGDVGEAGVIGIGGCLRCLRSKR